MKKIRNLALSLVFPALIGGCAEKGDKIDDYLDSVPRKVSQVLTPENNNSKISTKPIDMEYVINNKIKRNITSIGKNEFKFFTDFFNLLNNKDILAKIKSIQSDNGLKQDELLGPQTLKILYLKYYSKIDKSKLPFDILKRLEIYKEMEDYHKHPRNGTQYGTIKPMKVPDVFDKEYYFGDGVGENIPGTYINQELLPKVEKIIKKTGVVSKIIKVDGKFVIATYVNQELRLLSYISPGNPSIEGGVQTVLGKFNTNQDDMYHISSADASVKKTENGYIGAVMPYALHIFNRIYSHMGYVTGERESHGCIRLPFLYAKGLYEIYKNTGSMNWEITSS